MHLLFITTALCGLTYFLFAKRRFDMFSVAYLGSCVYFLPGFFGHARYPFATGKREMPLVSETYWVMIAVIAAIAVAAVVHDLFGRDRDIKLAVRDTRYAPHFATALAVAGFAMAALTTGTGMLNPDKGEMMSLLNRWHIVWVFGASVGAVLAYTMKRTWLLGANGVLLLIDVWLGFRMSFALSGAAIASIYLYRRGSQRLLLDSWKPLAIAVGVGFVVMAYKPVYIAIKMGNWDAVWERLTAPDMFYRAITESEPFTSQAVLNRVIESDFHVGTAHFSGLVYRVTAFGPELGAKTTSFNSQFQPNLFPGHEAGMAANIWAEMWSAGDWGLLLLFIFGFVISLAILSRLMAIRDSSLVSAVSLLGMYWSFYIHRNDIGYEVNLLRRVFVIWLLCVVASVVAIALLGKPREQPSTAGAKPRNVTV